MSKVGKLSRLIKVLPNFMLLQSNGVSLGENSFKKAERAYWQNDDCGKNKKLADYVKGVNIERTKATKRLQLPKGKSPQVLNERGFI